MGRRVSGRAKFTDEGGGRGSLGAIEKESSQKSLRSWIGQNSMGTIDAEREEGRIGFCS